MPAEVPVPTLSLVPWLVLVPVEEELLWLTPPPIPPKPTLKLPPVLLPVEWELDVELEMEDEEFVLTELLVLELLDSDLEALSLIPVLWPDEPPKD